MHVLLGAFVYWIRLLRRPIDARLKRRQVGGFAILALGVAVVELWLRMRPAGLADAYVFGEIAGVLAVYLMTWSLLLATRARWLEPWFGGLDRMYLRHKQAAIVGMVLLVPHMFVTGGGMPTSAPPNAAGVALGFLSALGLLALVAISLPRIGRILRVPYERWLFLHRLIGLFVALGVAHGLLVDRVVGSSAPLQAVYLAIGTLGVGGYLYAELLMRRLVPTADYTVATVTRPADDIVEILLTPVTPTGRAMTPTAGQFVFLRIGRDNAWREHPFSIAASAPGGGLRLSVRTLGRDTRRMHDRLVPGLPATVTGPYGMFDFTLGGRKQVWIAGGIGVVPFLSWLENLTAADDHRIDLFYSVPAEAEAVYLAELVAHGARLSSVRLHCVFTRSAGHLTGDKVIAAIPEPIADAHVFLCGPPAMVEDLSRDLRRRGVPRDYIHAEHFAFR